MGNVRPRAAAQVEQRAADAAGRCGAPDAAAPGPGREPGSGGRGGAGHAAGGQYEPGWRAAGAGRLRGAATRPDGTRPAGLTAARRRLGQFRPPADRPAVDLRIRRVGRSRRAHLSGQPGAAGWGRYLRRAVRPRDLRLVAIPAMPSARSATSSIAALDGSSDEISPNSCAANAPRPRVTNRMFSDFIWATLRSTWSLGVRSPSPNNATTRS